MHTDKSEDTGMGLHIRSAGSFHGFRVSRRDMRYCFEKFFHAERFDNFKNPVARFEGQGSIFRERLEPRMNSDAHGLIRRHRYEFARSQRLFFSWFQGVPEGREQLLEKARISDLIY